MDSPPPLPPQPSDQDYRNWLDLPLDVTSLILLRLDVVEILTSAQMVCLHWRNVCKDPSMWRTLNMGLHCANLSIKYLPAHDLCRNICRRAVYLSRGQLVEIKVGRFCDENLLKYITERSRDLRYLGALFWNFSISDKGLSEIAASIPLLEELEISYCYGITEKFLEAVGRSCPHLKSLKLRRQVCWGDDPFKECDLWAVAIAKNMPGLVSLQLDGNNLTNEGVQVILKGCPRLQSLELRRCRYVTMKGDFERCCSEQIRDLQFHCFSHREFQRMLEDRGYYDIDDDRHYAYIDNYDFDDFGFVSD